jgi:KTSC domain-containing protein
MEGFMEPITHAPKFMAVDANLFESVAYDDINHTLYIKFRDAPPLRLEKVPRFRYQGLMQAPRKDAYYKTFIKDQFLTKPFQV